MMRRSNPIDEIETLFDRMSRQFDDVGRQFESGLAGTYGIELDIADYDGEIIITADLPGFEKEHIDVTMAEQTLTISAERGMDEDLEEGDYIRRERRHTSARRSVRLPETVDEDAASASYTNGVLTITLPKLTVEEDDDSHHIDIN